MAQEPRAVERAPYDEPELWRVHLGSAFSDLAPEALERGSRAPMGALRGMALGAAAVFRVSGTPQVVERTSRAVRGSPGDFLKVCVQLRGRATVHQDGREIVIEPGRLAVYDTGRPYALRLEGGWSCAVMAVRRGAVDIAADRQRWPRTATSRSGTRPIPCAITCWPTSTGGWPTPGSREPRSPPRTACPRVPSTASSAACPGR